MLGITSPLIPAIQQDEQRNTPQLDPIEASWFGVCFSSSANNAPEKNVHCQFFQQLDGRTVARSSQKRVV